MAHFQMFTRFLHTRIKVSVMISGHSISEILKHESHNKENASLKRLPSWRGIGTWNWIV